MGLRFIKKHKWFFISISLLSGLVGFAGAFIGEIPYALVKDHFQGLSFFLGPGFGVTTGILYVVVLSTAWRKREIRFISRGTLYGSLAGLICALVVHLAYFILYKHSDYTTLMFGLICGMIAGTILGLISSLIANRSRKKYLTVTDIQ